MASFTALTNWYFTPLISFTYIFFCFAYLLLVYTYTKLTQSQPQRVPFIPQKYLKIMFVTWNMIASIFSALCFIDVVPIMHHHLVTDGFQNHICNFELSYIYPMHGMFLYCITKPLEFVDTILLMLYNKPIIFLHWYHHFLTVLCVLFICVNTAKHSIMGFWFGIINLFVHAIMYMYYALTAFSNPINGLLRKYSFLITVLQVSQMFMGVWLVYKSLNCPAAHQNLIEIFLYGGMYLSYVVLFMKLLGTKIIRSLTANNYENNKYVQ